MKENPRRLTRRQLIFGVAALAGLPLTAVAYANREALLGFSGEVEETKAYLAKWRGEVKSAFGILPKEYFPKIADLAIAFFCRQMGYDGRRFEGKITLLDSDSYLKKFKGIAECREGGTIIDDPRDVPMLTSLSGDRIYVNTQFEWSYNKVHQTFGSFLHELHHAAPLPRWDEEEKAYTRGLFVLKKGSSQTTSDKECLVGYGGEEEEMVVQDSTKRLLALLNLSFYEAPSEYREAYRRNVLDSLYRGDHRELLMYQQQSRVGDFHRSIGAKLGEIDREKQGTRGVGFMKSLFEGKLRGLTPPLTSQSVITM